MIVYEDLKQGTPEWLSVKAGKIGGTNSMALSSPDPGNEIYNLAGAIDTGRLVEGYKSAAMERGNELEFEAILALQEYLNEKIERVGFCQSQELDFLGFSPDGLFSNRTCVAEVKCPNDGTHIMYCDNDDALIEAYRGQVRQPFIVSDQIQKVLICSFNPQSNKPLHVVEVKREYFSSVELTEAKINMKINYKLAESKVKKLKF